MTEQKSPTGIDVRRDAIEIDAVIVAEGLGIVASHVPVLMRNGAITTSKRLRARDRPGYRAAPPDVLL